jgi:hypothetical protein
MARGDGTAAVELFAVYCDRLRLMVRLRLDRRLQGRLDPSDVLQETYFDVARRAAEFAANPTMPPYLWLRFLTSRRPRESGSRTAIPPWLRRRPGQRFEALTALHKAAAIGRELHQSPEWFDRLRNEAIAALALPDVHITHEFGSFPPGSRWVEEKQAA